MRSMAYAIAKKSRRKKPGVGGRDAGRWTKDLDSRLRENDRGKAEMTDEERRTKDSSFAVAPNFPSLAVASYAKAGKSGALRRMDEGRAGVGGQGSVFSPPFCRQAS